MDIALYKNSPLFCTKMNKEGYLLWSVNVTTTNILNEILCDSSELPSSVDQNMLRIKQANFRINILFPDTNECASHPCHHRSTCFDRISGYRCICFDGYAGTTCETGKSHMDISIFIWDQRKYTPLKHFTLTVFLNDVNVVFWKGLIEIVSVTSFNKN